MEEELASRLGRGEEVILATVVKLDGEPPSQTGAKLLMSRSAALAGTLGCSEFDSAALEEAGSIAEEGSPRIRTYRHDLGSIDVYVEPYVAAPTLLVPGRQAGELYVVHTNHDAPDLVDALEAVLPRNPRFIGLVGSRRHTGHHLEALRAKGVPEEVIERIQSPVGLDLGSRTPQEIALSILAGLVAVRRGGSGGWKASLT